MSARDLASAGIAHDLWNHLQILTSAINIIERQLPDTCSDVPIALRGARGAITRASMLCGAIRDNTDEVGSPTKAVTQLARMLSSLRDMVALVAGPAIEFEIRAISDASVLCDPRGLEDCVLNLASNACHAMPDGGRLLVEVYRELSRDLSSSGISHAVLCVRDTGCGMAPETVEAAFLPYFTTRPNGTGLGLANVRDFVRDAGGSIELRSEIGLGTSVTIRMPEWVGGDHVEL